MKNQLAELALSRKILWMADGQLVPSVGVWRGKVTVKGVSREVTFQVFKSNGALAILFGKPLLKVFNAIHIYMEDMIQILQEKGKELVMLENQFSNVQGIAKSLLANLTVYIKQLITIPQYELTKPHKVTRMMTDKPAGTGTKEEKGNGSKMYKLHGGFTTPLEGSLANQSCDNEKPCLADSVVSPDTDNGEQNKMHQKRTGMLCGSWTRPQEQVPPIWELNNRISPRSLSPPS